MIVDELNPPPYSYMCYGGSYWERSLDPWHPDAFPSEFNFKSNSRRKGGWMLIDWIENPIGFVSDDTLLEGDPDLYDIKPNPKLKYDNLCAFIPSSPAD